MDSEVWKNTEHRDVFEAVLSAAYINQTNSPKCFFFLYRPAGKTFLYATLLHTIHRKSDLVTPVASTRSAATLFRCRRTAHSGFKIPILMNATSTCNIKPNSKKAQILLKTKLIIWDEAPMTHSHAFVAVSRLLCDITKYQKPFGGKIILFGGNFLQVLQVILWGSRFLAVQSV